MTTALDHEHLSHAMNSMSNFSSENLIERSRKTERQHFVLLYQYFFTDQFLRRSIIEISDNNPLLINKCH